MEGDSATNLVEGPSTPAAGDNETSPKQSRGPEAAASQTEQDADENQDDDANPPTDNQSEHDEVYNTDNEVATQPSTVVSDSEPANRDIQLNSSNETYTKANNELGGDTPTDRTESDTVPDLRSAGPEESSTVRAVEEPQDSFADLPHAESVQTISASDEARIGMSENSSYIIIQADSATIEGAVDSMIITQLGPAEEAASVEEEEASVEEASVEEEEQMEEVAVPTGPVQVPSEEFDHSADPYLLENNLLAEVDAQVVYFLLEEYTQQLEVLGKIINAPYIKDSADEKETLRQRFRRQEDEPIKIKGTRETAVVPANPGLAKIQHDRAYEHRVVECLMRELRRDSSYVPLLEAVEGEALRREEYVLIEEEAIANSQHIGKLQQEIKELTGSMTIEIAERNCRIFELRDELQEVLARTGMEVRYTQASMSATQDMDEARLHARRVIRRERAERARKVCDYETRVNSEIDSYLGDAVDKLNEKLDARLTKFDQDTDEKEREISNLKYRKQQNFQVLTEAKENFALYTQVIAEDDEEQQVEQERVALEERRFKAAITIQSFWLGYRERKKFKKKLKKMRKAAKKAAKEAGKGGGKSPPPKGKGKKKK